MAENTSGSQESLPLSQESYQQLFSLLQDSVSNLIENNPENLLVNEQACDALIYDMNRRVQGSIPAQQFNGFNILNTHEQQIVQDENSLPEDSQYKVDLTEWNSIKRPISSLPASENWPGQFCFSLSFNRQKLIKGISWIYSDERTKLYVCRDIPCPVNFSTNTSMPEEVYIRAMALFSASDHALEKVTRCVNHSMEEINKNIFEAEHFIRCESKNAVYENDLVTGRHSVVIPYENPPAGQMYSTYLYKFMCFGSCSGGPNRRALMVVFTLERRGEVIGRQTIHLKVCACPVRDFKSDNKTHDKPLKRSIPDLLPVVLPTKKVKKENKQYNISTSDRNLYKFLKKMEALYILHATVKNQPHLKQLLPVSSQSSSGEEA